MNKKGAALALVIVVFVALTLMVGVMFVVANASISSADTGVKAREAYLASKSGVEYLKSELAGIIDDVNGDMEAELQEKGNNPDHGLPTGQIVTKLWAYGDNDGNFTFYPAGTPDPKNQSAYKNARIQLELILTEQRTFTVTDAESGSGDYLNDITIEAYSTGKSDKASAISNAFSGLFEKGIKLPLPHSYTGMQIAQDYVGEASTGCSSVPNVAVCLRGDFSTPAGQNNQRIRGNLYSANGTILINNGNVMDDGGGWVYHNANKGYTAPGRINHTTHESIFFEAAYPNPEDPGLIAFPNIENYVNPAANNITVTQNTHVGTHNGNLNFDTSNGNLYVVIDILNLNQSNKDTIISVMGGRKLFLFIEDVIGGQKLKIENDDPDNLVIITKVQLKFDHRSQYIHKGHLVYQCEGTCEDTYDFQSDFKLSGSFVTNFNKTINLNLKGGYEFTGLFYAPEANIIMGEANTPILNGRLVANSLKMIKQAKIYYGSNYLHDFFGVWAEMIRGWPDDS